MAKHPKRRRKFGRYIRGNVDETLSLGTLAGRTLVLVGFDEGVEERTWISSLKASWSLDDWTAGANIGPFLVGVAHSDYTAAEVEAWIEQTTSWKEGDLIATREVGRRLIRQAGILRSSNIDGVGVSVLNEGRPFTLKLNWMLTSGQNLDLWAYNLGTSPLATTVPNLHVEGHANLWPR